jgi:ketosteroid isomerase-like protein
MGRGAARRSVIKTITVAALSLASSPVLGGSGATPAVAGMDALVSDAGEIGMQVEERDGRDGPGRLVEIRSYNLKPGARDRFHQLFVRESLPMLRRWKIDVVAYGPSLHDRDSYYLMRSFASAAERERIEDAFYTSREWLEGPRAAVLADIASYTTVVIRVDDATLRALRRGGRDEPAAQEVTGMQSTSPSDLNTLLELNRDYVRAVVFSDVTRFEELLAHDFLCSLPDGSLIDRKRFLEHTAKPITITNLQIHDVDVRILGDVAIVHARTTFTTADGRPGSGRYTDVWARRDGRWLAVSAHVTRN